MSQSSCWLSGSFDLEVRAPQHQMGTQDAGRLFDEIGMAQQFIDAAVVQMAVVKVVLFRQPLRPPRLQNLLINSPPHHRHLLLRDQRERPRPALLVVLTDLLLGEGGVGVVHGSIFTAGKVVSQF